MKKTDIAVISFTYRGAELAEHIQEAMDAVWSCKLYTKCSDARAEGIGISVDQPLAEWTGKQFAAGNALLFIGACGIAVRSIAPHVKDKLSDVPVLVADEAGQFVIPLLSGHIGGANALAEKLAEKLEADELMDSWEVSGDLFSTACEVVPDKQGRILLPAELRSYAGLEKDVTIIGNRNHAEIWATDVWNARRAAVSNEQRAARLRSLHI